MKWGLHMNELIKKIRERLSLGECIYGPFMKTGDPMFVEAAGNAGFDFVILDMEHGPVSLESQQNNMRAAALTNVLPIIRVKDMAENTIGSVLDAGACGVQVPQVKNAVEAKSVVRSARFYPYGMRGLCRFVRAAQYSSTDKYEYVNSSKDLLVIIQLEGIDAIKNIDEILEIEGVDIIFIGPYDLSQSLGLPGRVDHPKVIEEIKKIVEKAKAKNKVIGTFVDDLVALNRWRDAGVQYLSYNVDIGIFTEACKKIMNGIQENNR